MNSLNHRAMMPFAGTRTARPPSADIREGVDKAKGSLEFLFPHSKVIFPAPKSMCKDEKAVSMNSTPSNG